MRGASRNWPRTPNVVDSIRSLKSRIKYTGDTISGYTDKAAAQKVRRASTVLDNNAPARFMLKIADIANGRMGDLYRAKAATRKRSQV